METKSKLGLVAIGSAVLLMGAAIIGYQDWQLRGSSPGNPASGYLRIWADNTAGKFKCLTSGGAACYFDSAPSHSITFSLDGSGGVISTGAVGQFPSSNFSCTIDKAMVSSDVSGSLTVDIWKVNAAIPTSGNKISASAPVTLSSSQLNQNSALTGWSGLSVVANDVFGASVATASTVTKATVQLWCE